MTNNSKIDILKSKYLHDADQMASKSRFGYFSMPPSCSAGDTLFQQKICPKDEYGRVKTQQRNIFSGPTASGVLQKSYFSYSSSVYQGDPYTDPDKKQRKDAKQKINKLQNKQVYKPASLTKTMYLVDNDSIKAAYQYIPQKNQRRKKLKTDSNGKVIIQSPNIHSNSMLKIEKEKLKQFQYKPDPYDNPKIMKRVIIAQRQKQFQKDIAKRGEAPFKAGSPVNDYFDNVKKLFGGQISIQNTQNINDRSSTISNDQPFKLACKIKPAIFSIPQYIPEGEPLKVKKQTILDKQPFKLIKRGSAMKPCPSISLCKLNLLRSFR